MQYTLIQLESMRRIKIEMLNESRTKQGSLRLRSEIIRLEDEIRNLSNTPQSCQLCLEPIEGNPHKCDRCGIICCEKHFDKHICNKM